MGLISGDIIKPKRFRSDFQSLFNDIMSEDCMIFFHINPAAAVREHGENRFVVNLASERAQYVDCFGNNLFDKLVSQESNSWSHRNVLSIAGLYSKMSVPNLSNS